MDVPVLINLETIHQQREALRDTVLQREDKNRFFHNYVVGERVLKIVENPHCLEERATGPYPIEQVHSNGTVTIRLNAVTTQQLTIQGLDHLGNELLMLLLVALGEAECSV
jgi:hypothetical protein